MRHFKSWHRRLASVVLVALVSSPARGKNADTWSASQAKGMAAVAAGQYLDAVLPLEQALVAAAPGGKGKIRCMESAGELADVYLKLGRYKEADELYKKSLAIARSTWGSEDTRTIKRLGKLASFHEAVSGRFAGFDLKRAAAELAAAEKLRQQAVVISLAAKKDDAAARAEAMIGLALCFARERKYEQSERAYNEARRVSLQTSSPRGQEELSDALSGLADLYIQQNKIDQAEGLYQNALKNVAGTDAESDLRRANILEKLGLLYRQRKNPELAQKFFEQSLQIKIKRQGEGSPDTASTFFKTCDAADESAYKHALDVTEKACGKESVELLPYLSQLTALHYLKSAAEQSEAPWQKSLDTSEKQLEIAALDKTHLNQLLPEPGTDKLPSGPDIETRPEIGMATRIGAGGQSKSLILSAGVTEAGIPDNTYCLKKADECFRQAAGIGRARLDKITDEYVIESNKHPEKAAPLKKFADENFGEYPDAAVKKFEEALQWLQKAINADPKCEEAYRKRRDVDYLLGHLDSACDDELRLIECAGRYPDESWQIKYNPDIRVLKRASEQLDRAIAREPNNARLYVVRASLSQWLYHGTISERHYMEAALNDLSKAIELAPSETDLYLRRAALYCILEESKQGLADCNAAIKLDPSNLGAYNLRAHAYQYCAASRAELPKFVKMAMSDYSKIIAHDPTNAAAFQKRARLKMSAPIQEQQGAIDDYTKADRLLPQDDFNAHSQLASLKAGNGDYKGGIKEFQRCLYISPSGTTAAINLANLYRRCKDYARSLNYCNYAVVCEVKDTLCNAHLERALICIALGRLDDAIDDCSFVIEHASSLNSPDRARAQAIKAQIHCLRKEYRRAVDDCDKSLAEYETARAFYWRGRANMMLGSKDLAAQDLQKAKDKNYSPDVL